MSSKYLDYNGLSHLIQKIDDKIEAKGTEISDDLSGQISDLDDKFIQSIVTDGDLGGSFYIGIDGKKYAPYTTFSSVLSSTGETLESVLSGLEEALESILHR